MYTRETRSFPKENPHNSRSPVRAVLDHVDRYEEHPDGFWCVCPAHGDRNPSLHVEESEDGIALLICRAGCEQDRVMAALEARGMRRGELFAGSPSKGPKSPLNGPKKETTSS